MGGRRWGVGCVGRGCLRGGVEGFDLGGWGVHGLVLVWDRNWVLLLCFLACVSFLCVCLFFFFLTT